MRLVPAEIRGLGLWKPAGVADGEHHGPACDLQSRSTPSLGGPGLPKVPPVPGPCQPP